MRVQGPTRWTPSWAREAVPSVRASRTRIAKAQVLHAVGDLVAREPVDALRLVGGAGPAFDGMASEHERDHATGDVLVRPVRRSGSTATPVSSSTSRRTPPRMSRRVRGCPRESPTGPCRDVEQRGRAVVSVPRRRRRSRSGAVCRSSGTASLLLGVTRVSLDWTTGGVDVQLGTVDRRDDRPPFRQIADRLRAAIERGELRAGDRLALRDGADPALRRGTNDGPAGHPGATHRGPGRGRARPRGVRPPPAPVRRLASDRFLRRHREAGRAAFLVEAAKSGVRPSVDQIEVTGAPRPTMFASGFASPTASCRGPFAALPG